MTAAHGAATPSWAAVIPGALALGAAVTLGVRSEHMHLQEADGANTLPCRVQWVERLGDITYAYLEQPGGAPLVVRAAGDSSVTQGDGVRVQLPAHCCHLFDPDGVALVRLAGAATRLRSAA